MPCKEFPCLGDDAIREQSDPEKASSFRKLADMFNQTATETFAAMIGMNDAIFQENDHAAFGRTDREQQIDHGDDLMLAANDKDAASVRLLEDQSEAMFLFAAIRLEVFLKTKELHDQLHEIIEILNRGRGDP